MRKAKLAHAALIAIALGVPATGVPAMGVAKAATFSESQQAAFAQKMARSHHQSFNQKAAAYVKALEGVPYVYGGTSRSGFDCSGLTQYVYRHLGKKIRRTAEEQFREFRRISKARAWGGDLVFFHETSDPNSYVYHVGIYEGGPDMIVASTGAGHVIRESFAWAGNTVTFGTITH
jgi:cell wall-associated NlpC family hydrolase